MNRNTELHFGMQPEIETQRSSFDLSFDHKTTFNTGELVPIYVQEILPGDTFSLDTNFIVRMQTPIKPVMDNAYIDIYFFFVPNRLTWDRWEEFMGENKDGSWDEDMTEYNIPGIAVTSKQPYTKGTVADHMGLPINAPLGTDINCLPFRGYTLIWNDWFRNQNLQAPLPTYHQNDNVHTLTKNDLNDPSYGGAMLKVNKFADYFTTALPEPQKGDPVLIGIGNTAPVITSENANENLTTNGILWQKANGENWNGTGTNVLGIKPINDGNQFAQTVTSSSSANTPPKQTEVIPANLIADLTQATSVTINQLRQAFQIQKFLETDARSGTRYIEIIKGHFGVTSADARMQRPEYLGGERFPINMDQVLQTSESSSESPQGNTAAFSLTGAKESAGFTKSFTEHGYIIGVACVRTDHSYQQGVNRMWARKRKFDFYWREFAHLGEQEINEFEIYNGENVTNTTFGYQERYGEYRYNQNIITGEMRSTYAQPLDVWHYGDYYEKQPNLSAEWGEETTANVDRTLAVQSTVSDQFLAEFYFKIKATRPMPLYGVPGLIDHF